MSSQDDIRLALLEAEHQRLAEEIASLRRWWQDRKDIDQPNYGEMSRRVMDLHDHLAAHITREKEGGYLVRAAAERPEYQQQVAKLLGDHTHFRQAFEDLSTKLANGAAAYSNWDQPHQELEQLLQEVGQHEAQENMILHAAFGDDHRREW